MITDTYAENYGRSFDIDVGTVQFLHVVLMATAGTRRVKVKIHDDADHNLAGRIIDGVARHVVAPDSDGFVHGQWTDETRLRISGIGEFFIPLRVIEAIVIDD